MRYENGRGLTRRHFIFLSGSAVMAPGWGWAQRDSKVRVSANERLNIAGIGAGGMAFGDLEGAEGGDRENIVALCDVDWERGERGFVRWPRATRYRDYRVMLDREAKNIDAVVVATPDHTHAFAALAAMQLGKHVYVEKPLTHSIWEARQLLKAARRYGVATQMGNQGHSSGGTRRLCEIIWSGMVGEISEVHVWTDRPIWPQGVSTPLPPQPVPYTMAWDLWIGAAPMRPYNAGYAPFSWRGWWDFGCGALGDMGCHNMDPAFWALDLSEPVSVECVYREGNNDQTGPTKGVVRYEFPARLNKFAQQEMRPVTVYWYEGGMLPERPRNVPEEEVLGEGDNGSLFMGSKGAVTTGGYGEKPRFVPASRMAEEQDAIQRLVKVIPRVPEGHRREWVRSCKDGVPSGSHFEYSVPLTETVLLGNLALRTGEKIYWNAQEMRATNEVSGLDALIRRDYRAGYNLEV